MAMNCCWIFREAQPRAGAGWLHQSSIKTTSTSTSKTPTQHVTTHKTSTTIPAHYHSTTHRYLPNVVPMANAIAHPNCSTHREAEVSTVEWGNTQTTAVVCNGEALPQRRESAHTHTHRNEHAYHCKRVAASFDSFPHDSSLHDAVLLLAKALNHQWPVSLLVCGRHQSHTRTAHGTPQSCWPSITASSSSQSTPHGSTSAATTVPARC